MVLDVDPVSLGDSTACLAVAGLGEEVQRLGALRATAAAGRHLFQALRSFNLAR